MKIVGLMAARNEDWCLGLTARAALMWLDGLIILDHASTDRTAEIIKEVCKEFPDRVFALREDDPVWEEMRHRQLMLKCARVEKLKDVEWKATHICYIDADEILTGDLVFGPPSDPAYTCVIRGLFNSIPPNSILQIPWLALRGSIGQVHTSGPWADGQNASLGFLDDPRLHWSSEARGGYDFHHRQPMGKPLVPWTPLGARGTRQSGLMHLQFVNVRRLRAKQSWYKIQEMLRWPGREPNQVHAVNQRYNLAVYGLYDPVRGWQERRQASLGPVPMEQWWKPYEHLMKYFHPHEIPWQEAEVRRAIAEHGPELSGLDLFGLEEESQTPRRETV